MDCQAYKDATGHQDGDYGEWAYPVVTDLAERIATAAMAPRATYFAGSNYVRNNFTWHHAADHLLNFLSQLGAITYTIEERS